MSDVIQLLVSAAGVAVGLVWIGAIVAAVRVLVFRHRARAIARGTYPVRVLPWYLGGTPEMPVASPPERPKAKRRRR